jgi:hypothetical protein
MPNRSEIASCIEKLLLPTTKLTGAAQVVRSGAVVDTQGFDSAHFNIALGTGLAGSSGVAATIATTTGIVIADSSGNAAGTASGATFAATSDVVFTLGFDASGTKAVPALDKTYRVAYVGNKRFVKARYHQPRFTNVTDARFTSIPWEAARLGDASELLRLVS